MAGGRSVVSKVAGVACILLGCIVAAGGAGRWIVAERARTSVYGDAQQAHSLAPGSYPLSWLGPSHSERMPIYDEVTLAVGTKSGRARLRAPGRQVISPSGPDQVRSSMGDLVVEQAGTFRLSVDAHVPVSGRLEIQTSRSPANGSDRAQEIALLGLLTLGAGVLLLRAPGPRKTARVS